MSVNSSIASCRHNRCLFEAPLCKEQSVLRRIINIIFHIFTLGIPFLLYHAISCCCKSQSQLEKLGSSSSLLSSQGSIYKSQIPYEVEVECRDYAQELLCKFRGIAGHWCEDVDRAPNKDHKGLLHNLPSNSDINKLVAIMRGPLWDEFIGKLQSNQQHTWEQEEVLSAVDSLMKISMAIYSMTLEDSKDSSLEQAMMGLGYYQHRTLYYVWDIYSLVKLGVIWNANQSKMCLPVSFQNIVLDKTTLYDKGMSYDVDSRYNMKSLSCCNPEGLYQQKWKQWYNSYAEDIRFRLNKQEIVDLRLPSVDVEDHFYVKADLKPIIKKDS